MSLLLLNKERLSSSFEVLSPLCENSRSTYTDVVYNRLYGTEEEEDRPSY